MIGHSQILEPQDSFQLIKQRDGVLIRILDFVGILRDQTCLEGRINICHASESVECIEKHWDLKEDGDNRLQWINLESNNGQNMCLQSIYRLFNLPL